MCNALFFLYFKIFCRFFGHCVRTARLWKPSPHRFAEFGTAAHPPKAKGFARKLRAKPFVLISNVRQQRYLTGALDRLSQLTLMHRAGAGSPTGQDLAAVGHVPFQLRGVFIVDIRAFIHAELANFSPLAVLRIVLIESQGQNLL